MVRFKNRYLLVHVESETEFTLYTLLNCIKDSIKLNFGSCGDTHIQVKYYSALTNMAIIRVSRDSAVMLQQALFFMKGRFRCVHVGGTIKSCQLALIRYNKDACIS